MGKTPLLMVLAVLNWVCTSQEAAFVPVCLWNCLREMQGC
jgi:hypothetical protein